ncbi:hypothetical protein POKO110462_17005 [Pontibacter korlensis]
MGRNKKASPYAGEAFYTYYLQIIMPFEHLASETAHF